MNDTQPVLPAEALMSKLQSAILRQQVAQVLLAIFNVLNLTVDFDVAQWVDALFLSASGLLGIWTFVTRLIKPAPNLTKTAVAKENELIAEGKLS